MHTWGSRRLRQGDDAAEMRRHKATPRGDRGLHRRKKGPGRGLQTWQGGVLVAADRAVYAKAEAVHVALLDVVVRVLEGAVGLLSRGGGGVTRGREEEAPRKEGPWQEGPAERGG